MTSFARIDISLDLWCTFRKTPTNAHNVSARPFICVCVGVKWEHSWHQTVQTAENAHYSSQTLCHIYIFIHKLSDLVSSCYFLAHCCWVQQLWLWRGFMKLERSHLTYIRTAHQFSIVKVPDSFSGGIISGPPEPSPSRALLMRRRHEEACGTKLA